MGSHPPPTHSAEGGVGGGQKRPSGWRWWRGGGLRGKWVELSLVEGMKEWIVSPLLEREDEEQGRESEQRADITVWTMGSFVQTQHSTNLAVETC